MPKNRSPILLTGAVTALLFAVGVRILSDWGKITIHAEDRPLGEVITELSNKSGTEIFTTLPLDKRVTLHADRAELVEVLETLAVRVDGDWNAGFAIAPSKSAAKTLFVQWARKEREGFRLFRPRGFPFLPLNDSNFDPFRQHLTMNLSGSLQEMLRAASNQAEAVFLVPNNWDPPVRSGVLSGKVGVVVGRLAKSAGGVTYKSVLLSEGWRGMRSGNNSDRRSTRKGNDIAPQPGSNPMVGDRGPGIFDDREIFEGMVKRAEQRIAQLPKEEQMAAREEIESARRVISEIAALPAEERMAKMMERIRDPDFQRRIEERMTARDFRSTPQQRLERYSRYIERKMERGTRRAGN